MAEYMVKYGRTVSTGDYGNVRAEIVIPIVTNDSPTTEELEKALAMAWAQAMEEVHETINYAFEMEERSAPFYSGPRFYLGVWRPDPEVLLIIPVHLQHNVPGGLQCSLGYPGHRLDAAFLIGERWLGDPRHKYTEMLDFSDGDFEELEVLLERRKAEQEAALELAVLMDDDREELDAEFGDEDIPY